MPQKKIRIFADAEVLVTNHFSGIGHYTLEVLRALDRLIDNRDDVIVKLGVYHKDVARLKAFGFKNFKYRKSPFSLRLNNILKIKNLQPYYDLMFGKNVYFFPNYTSWPLKFSKSATVIYDLSFEKYPEYVEPNNQRFLSKNVRKSIERSEKIITISENSKKEICEFYNIPKHRVEIVYPGIDQSVFFRWPESKIKQIKKKYGIKGNYILFVGNIEPRKNLINMLLAYEKLAEDLKTQYSLLLVGAKGWLDEEIQSVITRLKWSGVIIQQPNSYVNDEDRAAIYSGASLFVYPSKYEGFGIPPLEAMACGVPAITSDNSSLPEVAGKSALMVPANSVQKLSNAMTVVLTDEKLRINMIKEGYKQVDKFSWDNEAAKLLRQLEELSNE